MSQVNSDNDSEELKKRILEVKRKIEQGKIDSDSVEVSQAIKDCIVLHQRYGSHQNLENMIEILEYADQIEDHRVEQVHKLTRQPLTYQWIIQTYKAHNIKVQDIITWFVPVKTSALTQEYLQHIVTVASQSEKEITYPDNTQHKKVIEKLDDQFYANISQDRILKAKQRLMNLFKEKNTTKLHREDYFTSLNDEQSIQNAIALSYLLTEDKIRVLSSGKLQLSDSEMVDS